MNALTRLYLTPATPETSDTPNIPRMLQPPPPKRLQIYFNSTLLEMRPWKSSNFQPSHAIPSRYWKSRLCARLLPEGHLEVHQGSEISGSPALYKLLGDQRFRWWPVQIFESKLGGLKQPNRLIDVDWVNMGKLWTRFVCLCLAKVVKSDWLNDNWGSRFKPTT